MTYVFVVFLILTMVLLCFEKSWKVVFECPSYLIVLFLMYATVNYGLAGIFKIDDYQDEYKIICAVSLLVTMVVFVLGLYFINVKLCANKFVQIVKFVLTKISLLAFVLWLFVYMRDLMSDFNLAFFELCTYAFVMVLVLSLLVAFLLLSREEQLKKIKADFIVIDKAVTATLFIVFIMSVGSKIQGLYVNIFTVLLVFVFLYLIIIEKKNLCLDFTMERGMIIKQYKSNVLRLLPSITLFSIMVFCENPLEFYSVNINTLPFGVGSFYIDFFRIALATIAGGCGLFALLKPKYISKITTFIFAIDAAIYIQVMFLNRNLGQTDLEKINWSDYRGSMAVGLLVWIFCIIVFYGINYKNTKTMELISKNGSLFLVALQMVSVVYMFICIGGWSGDLSKDSAQKNLAGFYYLTDENCYNVSDENVVVFILDTFSNDYMDMILKNDSNALSDFHDFTYYSNYNGSYDGTPLAMSYLLSGQKFDNTVSCVVSTQNAFASEHAKYFYDTLKENKIDARLYTDSMTQSWLGVQNIKDYYSNVAYDQDAAYEVYYDSIIKMMFRSTMYRISPMIAKPYFLVVTDDFINTISGNQSQKSNVPIQSEFETIMTEEGITKDEKGKSFIVYHFEGMHDAYSFSEDDVINIGKSNLNLVVEYMDQLKKLGVYDNTTIIVTADHGIHETIDGNQSIFMIKEANKKGDEYTETPAPIDAVDFLPTVLTCFDIQVPDRYGMSVFDINENMQRERFVYIRKYNAALMNNAKTANTNLGSSFNCLYQFNYIGDKEDLRKRDESKPDDILKLKDFWW